MHTDPRFTYHVQHSQRGTEDQYGVFEQGPGYFVEVATLDTQEEAEEKRRHFINRQIVLCEPEQESARRRREGIAVLLSTAQNSIRAARADLDTGKEVCAGCGRQSYYAWSEAQAHDALTGMLKSLKRWEERFRAGPTDRNIEAKQK